jgi:hypothetical protein
MTGRRTTMAVEADYGMAGDAGRGVHYADERPSPMSPTGFLIMLAVMAAEAVVLVILLWKPKPIGGLPEGGPGEVPAEHTEAELLAPAVKLGDVVVSVRVADGSRDLRTGVFSASAKLGKALGRADEVLDVGYLEKTYTPRVEALLPMLRHRLSLEVRKHSVSSLQTEETQQAVLRSLMQAANEELRRYGVEPRVQGMYWTFHFD